jgi:hypothetical protein
MDVSGRIRDTIFLNAPLRNLKTKFAVECILDCEHSFEIGFGTLVFPTCFRMCCVPNDVDMGMMPVSMDETGIVMAWRDGFCEFRAHGKKL